MFVVDVADARCRVKVEERTVARWHRCVALLCPVRLTHACLPVLLSLSRITTPPSRCRHRRHPSLFSPSRHTPPAAPRRTGSAAPPPARCRRRPRAGCVRPRLGCRRQSRHRPLAWDVRSQAALLGCRWLSKRRRAPGEIKRAHVGAWPGLELSRWCEGGRAPRRTRHLQPAPALCNRLPGRRGGR